MNNKFIPQTLSSVFPTWTAKQITDFTAFMQSNFKELNAIDPEFMLTNLHDSIALAQKKYGKVVAPGLLREIYKNEALRALQKRKKENNISVQIDEFGDKLEERFGDFDTLSSMEKIERFASAVRNSHILKSKEAVLFDAIEEVAKSDIACISDPGKQKAWKPSRFWKQVKAKLVESNVQINEAYFRKLKQRALVCLSQLSPSIQEELHFINHQEIALVQDLNNLLDFLPAPSVFNAYRCSTNELQKMQWLKARFEANGYHFNPNRFPEIYYSNHEAVLRSYPSVESGQEGTPDYLGVYLFEMEGENDLFPCSKEGIIVLFKDRIENYCSRHNVSEDAVRFVVLMHELGHWLSHWAIHEDHHWSLGYHLPNKRTHEGLAQLIAFWACKGNKDYLATLTNLSPRNGKGEVDTSAIYGGYILLTGHTIPLVLKKLAALRKFWMLKDEKMFLFLASDKKEVSKWMRTLALSDAEKPYIDLVEEEISNSLIEEEGDFFDVYFLKGIGKGVYKTLGFEGLKYKEIICELFY